MIDQPPYGTWAGREALDMAFSLAAFDQSVTLLFAGAGVNWLRKEQSAESIQQKSVVKNLSAAPIFGYLAHPEQIPGSYPVFPVPGRGGA